MRTAVMNKAVTGHERPLSARFVAKLVVDVLPAATASLIGSFLISQYQFHHAAPAHPQLERVVPASPEMMQLVRDEHAAIIGYLKAEMAAQQRRHAIEDEAQARAIAEAKAPPTPPARTIAVATPAATPSAPRTAAIMAAPLRQPLLLTHTEPTIVAAAAPVAAPAPAAPAPQPKSLLAATLDVKDQVVDTTLHATWHAVSAIGSIPSWIASFGGHAGASSSDADAGAARLRSS